jgi:hypothetical protein
MTESLSSPELDMTEAIKRGYSVRTNWWKSEIFEKQEIFEQQKWMH